MVTQVVQRSYTGGSSIAMNAGERHGRHKVLNMLKTLAEWSPRYVIARRWQKEGTRIGAGAD